MNPNQIYPWWRQPCKVKLLLFTDGNLPDFGPGDFGLSTFVSILQNDGRSYTSFELTLAHRSSNVSNPDTGAAVARSIPNFRFNNASHFTDTIV